ncbi:MAG: L-histidine N(alpha)-methyltransferase [Bacteroidota bacterium]
MQTPTITKLSTFASDVKRGLSCHPKQLPSKYFYDAEGDRLFQEIMAMPEYYLTNCEYEIFATQRAEILAAIGTRPFDLIELGAGDGTKTKLLLDYFLRQQTDFAYRPIDISGNVLQQLQADCYASWPQLSFGAAQGDYLDALARIQAEDNGRRKVVLFLGGNIGNFTQEEARGFLRSVRAQLRPGDLLLTGFDLKKDPATVLAAYNDPAGITAAFNLNLLRRINYELGANFDVDQFFHWETYNPLNGEARSYLVSRVEQRVQLEQLSLDVQFDAWEAIAVEVSTKYNQQDLLRLAESSGFQVREHFADTQQYFVDSLWEVTA